MSNDTKKDVSIASDFAKAMVEAQTRVAEDAVVVNKDSKSRAQRRREVDADLAAKNLDNEDPRPYIAYSTEACPHVAPTVAQTDFPKFVYKRGKKGQPDQAVKKVVWLTDLEAERIRRYADLKFMQVPVLDDDGNPVLSKLDGQPKMRAVPYSSFIRLVPTQVDVQTGIALDDPAEMVQTQKAYIGKLEAELAAFKSGRTVSEHDSVLEKENDKLRTQKTEAVLNEMEAVARDPENKTGKSAFRRKES